MRAENDPFLRWVAQWALALTVLSTVAAASLGAFEVALGFAVGGALAMGNFWSWKRMLARLLWGGTKAKGVAVSMATFKLGIFAAILFSCMRSIPMEPIALLCGISVVIGLICVGPFFGPVPSAARTAAGVDLTAADTAATPSRPAAQPGALGAH